ncbi:cytochrome P450 [Psychrobacillus glaciei]|uniref:Cytochrome P450 n=1 Tax=Psychrobacillus glaciei TaxID=2283160 RepID=A0A5J6SQT7_9BACI|nr:cytochrome P450 [Psychrobacillus glaciei]QFG00387.1 cytochrome P450 [Psychrobacillus glaciei]
MCSNEITGTDKKIDLMNLDLFELEEADDALKYLRENEPVYWNSVGETKGFWSITRYNDIVDIWKNFEYFTSEKGNMLRLFGNEDPAGGKMMVVTDPPNHQKIRRLHSKGMNPNSIKNLIPEIKYFVKGLFDEVPLNKSFDFVDKIAAKIPVSVTCGLLGIPKEDWNMIADLCRSCLAAEDSEFWKGYSLEETLTKVNGDLFFYLIDLVRKKRKNLSDDLISRLIQGEIDGVTLDDQTIALNLFSFILGGTETTKYAAAGGIAALIDYPEEMKKIEENRELLPSAIEEILRWTTPNIHVTRVATRDLILHGNNIKEGETLALWVTSANRDEEVFENSYQFNVSRTENRHITFGAGHHFCFGAQVAKMELTILLEEMLNRNYQISHAGKRERLRSNFLAGYKHLPLIFHT